MPVKRNKFRKNFNSRPSARGDVGIAAEMQKIDKFQFTPLREGRHLRQPERGDTHRISIHAPPRGATARLASVRNDAPNFNSRPSARGD